MPFVKSQVYDSGSSSEYEVAKSPSPPPESSDQNEPEPKRAKIVKRAKKPKKTPRKTVASESDFDSSDENIPLAKRQIASIDSDAPAGP